MSIKNIQSNSLTPKSTDTVTNNLNNWVRNPSWVTFPSITSSDNKFVGIFAVYNTTDNFVALVAQGNYDVDWGDGTSNLGNSGNIKVNKNFSYSSAALAGTDAPVTLTDTGDLVTRTAHGYTNGMPVSFYNIVSTTGLTEGQIYYVINATADTFKVTDRFDGLNGVLPLTTNGSATLLPYKQAIVTVTPASGFSFTKIDITAINAQAGLISTAGVTWLDIAMAGSALSTITIASTLRMAVCERVRILRSTVVSFANFMGSFYPALRSFELSGTTTATNMSAMLQNSFNLTDVKIESTTGVTNMSNMFDKCYSLVVAPVMNTASCTNMAAMFQSCFKLKTVPLYNTSAVGSGGMGSMFSGCGSLQSVPFFNTSNCQNMNSMFSGCYSLTSVPLFNTGSVTNMSSMFNNCWSLTEVPIFNTQQVTGMSSMFANCASLRNVTFRACGQVTSMSFMFNGCYSLQSVNLSPTTNVNNMSYMFFTCSSLKYISSLITNNVTTMSNMFVDCFSLERVPSLSTTTLLTNVSSMFSGCRALVTIPAINFTGVTTTATTSMFDLCSSISAIKMINMRNTFSVANLKLSGAALDEIYTNLPTVTAKTITVTGNYGTTTDTPSIATAKGWTVTG